MVVEDVRIAIEMRDGDGQEVLETELRMPGRIVASPAGKTALEGFFDLVDRALDAWGLTPGGPGGQPKVAEETELKESAPIMRTKRMVDRPQA